MSAARAAGRPAPGPELIERIAAVMKAMSDPVRLKLLYHLQSGEQCVGDLVAKLDCSQANVSKHLALLKQAGLVSSRNEASTHYYKVSDPVVGNVCNTVCAAVEERLANDRRLVAPRRR